MKYNKNQIEEIWIYNLKYQKWDKKIIIWKHNYMCQFYSAILDKDLNYFSYCIVMNSVKSR